jgi:hypothetical protein
VSRTVVEVVAQAEGVNATALRTPLYEAVDPEALDALFEQSATAPEPRIRVEFEYHDYRVRVETDCTVIVDPVAEADSSV